MQKKSKFYNSYTIIAGILVGFLALMEAGNQFSTKVETNKDAHYSISIPEINHVFDNSKLPKKLYKF